MAILNSIRKRGIFLILIIALALFAFILSDILTKGSGPGKDQDTVAIVNGTEISRQDFMQQVEATQRNLGPNATTAQAMNMVWERELRSTLLAEQYEELGLTVEKEQLNSAMRQSLANNPQFQNELGEYDEALVQSYVSSIKGNPQLYGQWQDYIKNIKEAALQNMYINLVRGGLASTLAEGKQQYHFENDKINIQYVQVPYTKIADEDVSVSEEEIKQYISEHKSEYEVDKQIDIQYVFIAEEPSSEDIQAANDNVAALINDRVELNDTIVGFKNTTDDEGFVNLNSDQSYTDRWYFEKDLPQPIADTIPSMSKGDIYGPYQVGNSLNLSKVIAVEQLPDSVKSRHILIRYQGLQTASQDVTRSKEAAKKLADSLSTVINRDKSKFEALAAQFSEDNSNKDDGGDLGYVGPGRMVPAFNDFIFDNNEGTVGVVETNFGFHVAQVLEQKNRQRAVKIATVIKQIEPSESTINNVFSKATTFEVAAKKGDFEKVAEEQNLTARPVNKIGELDANIPGVGSNRSIITWGFEEETSVGDVKRFNTPGGYVIAQLTRKSPKGLMSVSEASSKVTPILRKKKKAEKIRQSISGSTLQDVASSQSVTLQTATAVTMANPIIPGAGSEPKVVGAAFGEKAGETTGLIDGEKGVYKVRVLAVNKAPELDNYASYVNQLNAANNAVNSKVYQALKKKADIEDNRAKFY
ncbi:peptidylprolyl isomerase [Marixanthomonas sp. SCSIO 43207]|uniref:peptidylprolyl isomerase n=1 Tax=Marixanthomonas sp. SCSIO 43207 TaxID=2779360 RepID=UPI001CA90499|nr:peptidylprolyl isomerase [Marixanthomonas sp. SCSIO 43207]UAB82426.1 peptidylprolyl isomerase [Marixanthomonas sp. SCSIO 43207]